MYATLNFIAENNNSLLGDNNTSTLIKKIKRQYLLTTPSFLAGCF